MRPACTSASCTAQLVLFVTLHMTCKYQIGPPAAAELGVCTVHCKELLYVAVHPAF